jgi:hypothetical protein
MHLYKYNRVRPEKRTNSLGSKKEPARFGQRLNSYGIGTSRSHRSVALLTKQEINPQIDHLRSLSIKKGSQLAALFSLSFLPHPCPSIRGGVWGEVRIKE